MKEINTLNLEESSIHYELLQNRMEFHPRCKFEVITDMSQKEKEYFNDILISDLGEIDAKRKLIRSDKYLLFTHEMVYN